MDMRNKKDDPLDWFFKMQEERVRKQLDLDPEVERGEIRTRPWKCPESDAYGGHLSISFNGRSQYD